MQYEQTLSCYDVIWFIFHTYSDHSASISKNQTSENVQIITESPPTEFIFSPFLARTHKILRFNCVVPSWAGLDPSSSLLKLTPRLSPMIDRARRVGTDTLLTGFQHPKKIQKTISYSSFVTWN